MCGREPVGNGNSSPRSTAFQPSSNADVRSHQPCQSLKDLYYADYPQKGEHRSYYAGVKSTKSPFGETMKRRATLLLFVCLTAASVIPAHAQPHDQSRQQMRAYRKASKKAQKGMKKYNKQQRKAWKKSIKAQKKALKRARQNNTHY